MSTHASVQLDTCERPRVLFVDDEQRVLNSMRIMFRRSYDLYLAGSGREALEILKRSDIDVIVADHRMPQMTGVELLAAARAVAPRTVRILLTGYADLNAVEGSINDCEVFRFLTKPCAPDELRATIASATRIARETPALPGATPEGDADIDDVEGVEIILESDSVIERTSRASVEVPAHAPDAAGSDPVSDYVQTDVLAQAPARHADTIVLEPSVAAKRRLATGLGVVVFSTDESVLEAIQNAVRGRVPIYRASNIVQVVKVLGEHRPGVLVTDISEDKATLQAMTARLKSHLPELVTIAVSQHRDVLDMVWLINHGQIFRFLRKPLSPGRCAVSLQAALKHHRMLLKNPALAQRYEVQAVADGGLVEGVLDKLRSVRRLWASI
jgi:DNA-binding NtrC family response regulator